MVPILIAALEDKTLRYDAVSTLGGMRERAKPALPHLERLRLRVPETDLRLRAVLDAVIPALKR